MCFVIVDLHAQTEEERERESECPVMKIVVFYVSLWLNIQLRLINRRVGKELFCHVSGEREREREKERDRGNRLQKTTRKCERLVSGGG
jgi:hypothetical protein